LKGGDTERVRFDSILVFHYSFYHLMERCAGSRPASSLVLVMALLWGAGAVHSAEVAAVGKEALDFTLPYLTDSSKELTLSDYYGQGKDRKKAIILTFFASWCAPCKKELPRLEALWERLGERGLLIVDVCVDNLSAEKAKQIIAKAKVTFPVLHDRFTIVKDRYGVRGLPTMFLLDGEGTILKTYHGFAPAIEKEVTQRVEALAGEKK